MDNGEKQPFLLKNIFSKPFVEQLASEVFSVHPTFERAVFSRLVLDDNWEGLELKQRARHISICLKKCLPPDFADALSVLVKTVEQMLSRDGERMTFEWMVFPDFVEAFGVEEPEISIPALETMTRLASAEFAVRPFLLHYPEKMLRQMLDWSLHESPMVRRLASEGFRPRLPWGYRHSNATPRRLCLCSKT